MNRFLGKRKASPDLLAKPTIADMRSMTGYGRGERTAGAARVVVELKAVNRRQSEIILRVPRELEAIESRIREEILKVVSRGRVEAVLTFAREQALGVSRINRSLAASYYTELSRLAMDLGLTGGVSLEVLLRCPGVLEVSAVETDADELWSLAGGALAGALQSLDTMRRKEGDALAADIHQRIVEIQDASQVIRNQLPEAGRRLREQLLARIAAAGLTSVAADDERVIREVVFYADRSDISEELARLQSHLVQYEACRTASEPVGRKLDFLAQEMNREINTVGSKANDAAIAAEVIRLKTELERFREQVQNIE